MSAPGSAPGAGLMFAYLRDLLDDGRALSLGDIAVSLGWTVDTARQVAGEAAEAGLLDVSDGRYFLTGFGAQR